MTALDWLLTLLFTVGGAFVFIGGIGALRLPDVYTRIHAAGLTDTLGPMFVLGACILQAGFSLAALKLAAILVFLLLTTPTATHALANAARLADVRPLRIGAATRQEARE
jgi:multicomponent Na+:H+ antiporter subunit G